MSKKKYTPAQEKAYTKLLLKAKAMKNNKFTSKQLESELIKMRAVIKHYKL